MKKILIQLTDEMYEKAIEETYLPWEVPVYIDAITDGEIVSDETNETIKGE